MNMRTQFPIIRNMEKSNTFHTNLAFLWVTASQMNIVSTKHIRKNQINIEKPWEMDQIWL